jgi:hypothetical protein
VGQALGAAGRAEHVQAVCLGCGLPGEHAGLGQVPPMARLFSAAAQSSLVRTTSGRAPSRVLTAAARAIRGPDLGSVVITLATSVPALDVIGRTVMSTELLPGEDPALLPGPDRIEIHHVTGYHLLAALAVSTEGH